MSTARERRERRQTQAMVSRPKESSRQIERQPSRSARPKPTMPPFVRWLIVAGLALILVLGVILALGALNPIEEETAPNAIWLNQGWTYAARPEADLLALAQDLRQHQVGTLYAYVSSLKVDGTWSGSADQRNRFVEVEPLVQSFVQQARQVLPNGQIYAWIEVHAEPPQGYRLNNPQIHRIVADFAARMVNEFGFDGVLMDVKPIFNNNEDLLTFLRVVRGGIGLDTPLAVAVPPDFTPPNLNLSLTAPIAPNTVWDEEYKQRVSLQADELVIVAYNSYVDNIADYQRWVAYQLQAYIEALDGMETSTRIMLSIPNYSSAPPAHLADIETMEAALVGAQNALAGLSDNQTRLLRGIAIYTDRDLSTEEWSRFRSAWQRN